MTIRNRIGSPVGRLLNGIATDQRVPDPARPESPELDQRAELDRLNAQMRVLLAEVQSRDPWTSRARPSFLYVMYALLLWSLPMGLIAAVRPTMAHAIAAGMTAYLNGLPEPLYTLFGTGYLGYTVARTWGKAKGVEK